MKRQYYFAIFVIALLIRIGVGLLQKSPGFMDAEYYFLGGKNLVQGNGFTENIIWNYLDDPSGLPHPSHSYWMPLASLLAALGLVLVPGLDFESAQYVFILISSLLPPLTAYLCFLLSNDRSSAILAGSLAILSGYFLPYMTTTDTFSIYAICGALFFILLSEPHVSRKYLTPIAIGVVAGLMHFSRTDGILWLGFAVLGVLASNDFRYPQGGKKYTRYSLDVSLVLSGYLAIMGPWYLRNIIVFGSPLVPGGSSSLWITRYDEVFIYPASQLTMERWLSTGLNAILEARQWALSINLQRSIAEQGLIFLSPLIVIGLWQSRKDYRIQLGSLAWLITFLTMTFVFPFQGARGGFFHSSAALLPILWAAAPIGFNGVLGWAHKVRNWNIREAKIVFTIAILCFTVFLTIFIGWDKFNNGLNSSGWEQNVVKYQQIEKAITAEGANQQEVVLTINPPGYFVSTNRPAIAIPDGDINTLLEVAKKYGAKYVILEKDHPVGFRNLYENPDDPINGLRYLLSISDSHLFIVE